MLGNEPQLKLITKVLFLLCFTFFSKLLALTGVMVLLLHWHSLSRALL